MSAYVDACVLLLPAGRPISAIGGGPRGILDSLAVMHVANKPMAFSISLSMGSSSSAMKPSDETISGGGCGFLLFFVLSLFLGVLSLLGLGATVSIPRKSKVQGV